MMIALRTKAYAYKLDDDDIKMKKAKGTKKKKMHSKKKDHSENFFKCFVQL